ncbi:MAG TPA: glycosyltransferase [Gemmatimonadaceae bacterium]|nr:glycosyltransferase [Gemmatimonadaceae bacterium]
MRILLLNYEYPPLGGGGGIASAALVRDLVERGHAVDVVTSRATPVGGSTPGGVLPAVEQPASMPGLTLYRVDTRRRGIHDCGARGALRYVLAAAPVARRLLRANRYDLVHVFFSLPTGALLPMLPLKGTPVVTSLRGSDVPWYNDGEKQGLELAHQLLRPLTRWIWRRSDRVVALSHALGELARRTLPTLEFDVVHNGVDVARFAPPLPDRRFRFEHVRCLAVARLIERKGLRELLDALALLDDARYSLEIVGAGPELESLSAHAERLGIASRVSFSGPLDRDALAERYRAADLFVLAPSSEAFGNVFAEAMASGLPVIASNTGGIPEFVRHEEHGLLVPHGDVLALARAIQMLGDHPDRRARISARNRAVAQAEMTWATATDRYLGVYASVLGDRLPSNAEVRAPAWSGEPVAAGAVRVERTR